MKCGGINQMGMKRYTKKASKEEKTGKKRQEEIFIRLLAVDDDIDHY